MVFAGNSGHNDSNCSTEICTAHLSERLQIPLDPSGVDRRRKVEGVTTIGYNNQDVGHAQSR